MSKGSLGSMGSAIDLDSEGEMLCDSWGLVLRGGGWSGALGVAAMTTIIDQHRLQTQSLYEAV